MKIYTKKGDGGKTQLSGGVLIKKDDLQVEVYGTIDELNSWIGFVISNLQLEEQIIKDELFLLQNYLFDCGTDLSTPLGLDIPTKLNFGVVSWLENRIDFYTNTCPKINQFILPGGTSTASLLHISRTITRRVERLTVQLDQRQKIDSIILPFLNRLSDYLFSLARYVNYIQNNKDIYYNTMQEY